MVDLISVDTERVMGLVPYLNMLWYAPLEIGLCVYFLYKLIGWLILCVASYLA